MNRLLALDNIRGIAFILMLIHHLFYFTDFSNNYSTYYSNNIIISNIGKIARTLFIFLVGYSMVYSYKEKNYLKKRIKNSLKILFHALLITIITFIYFPNNYIRFGILHFIGTITLLLGLIVPFSLNGKLYYILLILFYCLDKYQYNLPKMNSFIDLILYDSQNIGMMDYFPLISWTPIVLLGMIAASNNLDKILIENNLLTMIGQNSLNLYTGHIFIIILSIYYFIHSH